MTSAIIPVYRSFDFTPLGADKNTLSRLRKYQAWVNPDHLLIPDLTAYRDYLVNEGLQPSSVSAHLASVRARYRQLLKDNRLRDYLYHWMPDAGGAANLKAQVDEIVTRLENAIDPDKAKVTVITEQDEMDEKHLRLTAVQAETLIRAPLYRRSNHPLQAIRDAAMIALMLCTGIREMELCAVQVEDLRTLFGGELSLRVKKGKGCKARSIPYGELDWCLSLVDQWLTLAGITEGAVFRGVGINAKRVSKTGLTVRAINQILDKYPIMISNKLRVVKPHDLRRTYARCLYLANVPILAIQQNLGHADHKTTEGYIGTLDASKRRAPKMYQIDLVEFGVKVSNHD